MSIITVRVEDHELIAVISPTLAAESINADTISAEFDSTWDGFSKICGFFTDKNPEPIFRSFDSNNNVKIPASMLREKTMLYFGISGTLRGTQKTTTLLRYEVEKGIASESPDDTEDTFLKYVPLNQGTDNSGKLLVVGADGKVKPSQFTEKDITDNADNALAEIASAVKKDADSGGFYLETLATSAGGEVIDNPYCLLPFNNFDIVTMTASLNTAGGVNTLKVQLLVKIMTDIQLGVPVFETRVLTGEVELPQYSVSGGLQLAVKKYDESSKTLVNADGTEKDEFIPTATAVKKIADDSADAVKVPIPIMKYADDDSELTAIDGTEKDEFIPTASAVTQMTRHFVSKVSNIENGVLITGNTASEIFPFAAAEYRSAEILEESNSITGRIIQNYYVDENFLGSTGNTDSANNVLEAAVSQGVYTVKFPNSSSGLVGSFWNAIGNLIVSSSQVKDDVADVGMMEFLPNTVLISGWSNVAVTQYTNGSDHYAEIIIPVGGAYLYAAAKATNGSFSFEGTQVFRSTYSDLLQNDESIKKYVTKIGDWRIRDKEAYEKIAALETTVSELQRTVAGLKGN